MKEKTFTVRMIMPHDGNEMKIQAVYQQFDAFLVIAHRSFKREPSSIFKYESVDSVTIEVRETDVPLPIRYWLLNVPRFYLDMQSETWRRQVTNCIEGRVSPESYLLYQLMKELEWGMCLYKRPEPVDNVSLTSASHSRVLISTYHHVPTHDNTHLDFDFVVAAPSRC